MESELELRTASHMFRYEQLSRDIDKLNNIDDLRTCCKSLLKLYLAQQEVLSLHFNVNGPTY